MAEPMSVDEAKARLRLVAAGDGGRRLPRFSVLSGALVALGAGTLLGAFPKLRRPAVKLIRALLR